MNSICQYVYKYIQCDSSTGFKDLWSGFLGLGFKVWRLELHIQHCSTHSLHELPISTAILSFAGGGGGPGDRKRPRPTPHSKRAALGYGSPNLAQVMKGRVGHHRLGNVVLHNHPNLKMGICHGLETFLSHTIVLSILRAPGRGRLLPILTPLFRLVSRAEAN